MSTNFRKQQLEHAMTHDLRNQVMRGQTHPHAQAQFAKGGEEMAALRPAVDKKPRGMERVAFHEVYGVAAKAAPAARPAAGYGVSAKGGGFVVSFEEEFGGGARKEAGGCAGGCGCGGACGGEKAAAGRTASPISPPVQRPRQISPTTRPTSARPSPRHAFERGRSGRHVVRLPQLPLYKLGQSTGNPDGSVTWGTCAEAIAAAKQANLTVLYLAMMGFAEFDYTKLPFVVVCNDGTDGGTVYPNPTPNVILAPGCAPGERVFALDEDDMSSYDPAADFVAQVIASEDVTGMAWIGPQAAGCVSSVDTAWSVVAALDRSEDVAHKVVRNKDGTYSVAPLTDPQLGACPSGQLFTECQGIWACRSADSVCEGPPCIGTDWTCCAEKDCTGIGTLGCACDQSGNNCVPVCT